jgi:DNA-binding Lrp family transcriptional regulator
VKILEAYVLIKIATQTDVCGFSRSVLEKINNKLAGIKNADLLFGDFDAILKLNMPKIHDIENAVMEEIQMIEGVESTLTLLCVDEKVLE